MEETVRYNYRLRPGVSAVNFLIEEHHRSRFLWNEAVHQFRAGRKPTFGRLSSLLTEARSNFSWLRTGSSISQQQTLKTYSQSLNQSFKIKGRGRPKFKKKYSTLPSLEYVGHAFGIKDRKLRLPKGIVISVVWSRELPSKPTSVRVYQDSLGHWYCSFVVKREAKIFDAVDGEIGIDWGVKQTATTTNPEYDLPYQGFRKRCSSELAKQQRKLSRKRRIKGQTQSNGYKKQKKSVAKIHKKAARQVLDSAHKWSNSVVENHDLIAVEDFKSKFLAKSTMARKASDAAIGTYKRILEEKATKAGRKLVKVNPAYTTMTCSNCFARAKQRLELSQRTFICEECGLCLDRDLNAAKVILNLARESLSGQMQVSADDVRQGVLGIKSEVNLQSELRISSL